MPAPRRSSTHKTGKIRQGSDRSARRISKLEDSDEEMGKNFMKSFITMYYCNCEGFKEELNQNKYIITEDKNCSYCRTKYKEIWVPTIKFAVLLKSST